MNKSTLMMDDYFEAGVIMMARRTVYIPNVTELCGFPRGHFEEIVVLHSNHAFAQLPAATLPQVISLS